MKTSSRFRYFYVGIAALLSLALLSPLAAEAHSTRRAPISVAPAAPYVVSTEPLPPFVQPPRSLHPCGSPDAAVPSDEIRLVIAAAARESGASEQLMLAIARGETAYNPNDRNPTSSARGLFQHLGRYWGERVTAFNRTHPDAPLASGSIFDITSQARVTAWMLSGGYGRISTHAWDCSRVSGHRHRHHRRH